MKTNLLSILVIICLVGCKISPESKVKTKIIQPYRVSDQISDSTFFGFISDLTASDSLLGIVDRSNGRLIITDHELNLRQIAGRTGKGPGETQFLWSVCQVQNRFYLSDVVFKRSSVEGDITDLFETQGQSSHAFAVDPEEQFYFSFWMNGTGPIRVVNREGKVVRSFGEEFKVPGNARQQSWFQIRELFRIPDGGGSKSVLWTFEIGERDIRLTGEYELRMPGDLKPNFFQICMLNDSTLLVTEMNSLSLCFFRLGS